MIVRRQRRLGRKIRDTRNIKLFEHKFAAHIGLAVSYQNCENYFFNFINICSTNKYKGNQTIIFKQLTQLYELPVLLV